MGHRGFEGVCEKILGWLREKYVGSKRELKGVGRGIMKSQITEWISF